MLLRCSRRSNLLSARSDFHALRATFTLARDDAD
jgi:hypothetical protein